MFSPTPYGKGVVLLWKDCSPPTRVLQYRHGGTGMPTRGLVALDRYITVGILDIYHR